MKNFTIVGNIVDVLHRRIFPGTIHITDGRFQTIVRDQEQYSQYILPGFIDAHVHIESSMLVPTEFARLATVHGTVATVSDPHEIANVLGLAGVEFMVDNAAQTPFKIAFGFPACVPATEFETVGAKLTGNDFRQLFAHGISYLSEVMNVARVLADTPEMMDKVHLAQSWRGEISIHSETYAKDLMSDTDGCKVAKQYQNSMLGQN